jgi:hypothetical protein
MKASTIGVMALAALLGTAAMVHASPVIYTMRTVASGRLGSMSFTDARVTISFAGDTANVRTKTVNGAVVYTNSLGVAHVGITGLDGGTVHATFKAGQIYARYDTQLGLVGFASAIGLAYPIIVGCSDPFVCSGIGTTDGFTIFAHYDGIATELADIAAHPEDVWSASADTLNLPTSLSESTLLTGHARACSVAFASDASCPSAPSKPLHTDRGDLYLLDMGYDYQEFGPSAIFTVTVLPECKSECDSDQAGGEIDDQE